MKLPMFSLLDIKSGIHNTPWFMVHAAQAIRACVDLAQDLNTTVGRHPADFQLVQLGTFDDQTGVLEPCAPVVLGLVVNFLPPRPANHTLPGIDRPRSFEKWAEGPPSASHLPADDPLTPSAVRRELPAQPAELNGRADHHS